MLKTQNSALTASQDDLRARMAVLAAQLDLPKDEIAKLRKLNLSAVADRLGHMGVVNKGENAIDLVKRINGFEYAEAVAWLHAEFGAAGAASAVREHLEVAQPARPLTTSEKSIQKAINIQLDALGCDAFRVSLISRDGVGAPFLTGKVGGAERFYSRADVENLVPYLRYENNSGRHVFVTPMDDDAYYVLVDDLRRTPEELQRAGYAPCLLQRSSWDSMQAMFKVPRSQIFERQAVVDVFTKMNQEFGDVGMTGLRHPMRLAGFRNMKAKHEREGKFPFVRVISAVNRFCQLTLDRILQRQDELLPRTTPTSTPRRR
ncbi:DNA-primase RepB domain-containing protein, partial [Rhizobium leguminosarum]|uniref:DNA-primase RepB domain-containing protein n=1 Tax=Rhizobium leguminosarum TaxID=384 RepID=UPI00103FE750